MHIPRLVIAGTNSGCGKTTLTTGIMGALVKRGLKVQSFKVGPDYIDPMFHTFITGRSSRNLDSWMLDENTVSYLFAKNSADVDVAVIEGVMGMYDGYGGTSQTGSTAHVSQLIKAPVILVVNGEGMSLSVAALVQGFKNFNSNVNVKGVIINNIKSEAHYKLLKEVIEENTGLVVAGYLTKMQEYSLQSRHLGLVPSEEIEGLRQKIELLTEQIEKTVDLDLLLSLAGKAEAFHKPDLELPAVHQCLVRIGVARDKAFNFYYQDNFDLLTQLGAELVYFSPLEDHQLPDGLDGLYIGGGYPEVCAGKLQDNHTMRESIKQHIENGMPAYAECGGLMYLSQSIEDRDGRTFEMVGIIPGKSRMTSSLQRFGYVDVEMKEKNALANRDGRIRAHEFHYSVTTVEDVLPACYKVKKQRKGKEPLTWECGYRLHNLLAGYPHLHFWGNPEFAKEFINNCKLYRQKTNLDSL